MSLHSEIYDFREALRSFNGCPEILLSSSDISAEAQRISEDFFSRRSNLVKLGLSYAESRAATLSQLQAAVYRWAVWNQTAGHCASFLLCKKGKKNWGDSSLIMKRLAIARNAMFDVLDNESFLE